MAGAESDDPSSRSTCCAVPARRRVRVAVPDLTGRLPLMKVSDRLTDIAELICAESLALSWQQIVERHGVPQYGPTSHGLARLDSSWWPTASSVASSLATAPTRPGVPARLGGDVQRTTAEVVDNGVFFLRLVQRLVHVLTVHTAAGRLYEVDTRLRPSGKAVCWCRASRASAITSAARRGLGAPGAAAGARRGR